MDMNTEARDPNNHIKYAKRSAAYMAVDENIENEMVIGIGSGTTIIHVVERIKQLYNKDEIDEIICIPTSFQSEQLLIKAKLPMGTLNQFPEIDLAIDGADEINKDLDCIKGGGGCALQEKLIASNAKKFIVVADYRKKSTNLSENWKKGIPIEVISSAWVSVKKKLERLGGNVNLRKSINKAGPVITDTGNIILDVDFGIIENPKELNDKLISIPGVIETGLFINMVFTAYIGEKNGQVTTISKTF